MKPTKNLKQYNIFLGVIKLLNQKCILVYGLQNHELVELTKRKIKYILIDASMINLKIKDIIDGKKDNISSSGDDLINEKILLFNDYEEEILQKNIKNIRNFIKGGILAVVTDTSREWTFDYLARHLIEEKEWFSKR